MSDPIIDLIIRIKNGYSARRATITSPHSTYREAVLKRLQDLGYITSYEVSGDVKKVMAIVLKYDNTEPAVRNVRIASKPGKREYISANSIKSVQGGLGASLISTPKGVLTNNEAQKENVGGELLFEIW